MQFLKKRIEKSVSELLTSFDSFHKQSLKDISILTQACSKLQLVENKVEARVELLCYQDKISVELAKFSRNADYILFEAEDEKFELNAKDRQKLQVIRSLTYDDLEKFWVKKGIKVF